MKRAAMTWADRLVMVLAGAAVLTSWWMLWSPGDEAEWAEVRVQGQTVARLALDQPGHYHFEGSLGRNEIEVADGGVRFIAAPCTGRQCIHAGWLRHGGDFAACLPNRVSLAMISSGTHYDAINF